MDEMFKRKRTVAYVFARSFWTTCSFNFEFESLYFEVIFVKLVGIDVATLWATLIVDNNSTDVVLFVHIFGIDTHSIKVSLIIDVRRTIEDDIRNDLHLIGPFLRGNKFITNLRNDETCFHFIWCSIGIEINENNIIVYLDLICTLLLESAPCNMVVHISECDAWLDDLNEDVCTKILNLLCICSITKMVGNSFKKMTTILVLMAIIIDDYLVMISGFVWIIFWYFRF